VFKIAAVRHSRHISAAKWQGFIKEWSTQRHIFFCDAGLWITGIYDEAQQLRSSLKFFIVAIHRGSHQNSGLPEFCTRYVLQVG
jgi:hypothetical protein